MPYKIKDFGAQKNQILNFYRSIVSSLLLRRHTSCGAFVGFSNHHNQSSIASLRVAAHKSESTMGNGRILSSSLVSICWIKH
jgi:hypothetical protein